MSEISYWLRLKRPNPLVRSSYCDGLVLKYILEIPAVSGTRSNSQEILSSFSVYEVYRDCSLQDWYEIEVSTGVGMGVGVGVGLGVGVGVCVSVRTGVAAGVDVGPNEGVAVGLCVGVGFGVGTDIGVGIAVGITIEVGVGVASLVASSRASAVGTMSRVGVGMAVGNLAFPSDVTTVSGLIVGSGDGAGAGVGFATLVCDGTSVVFGAGAPPVQASPMTPEVNNINTKDRSRMCPTAGFILLFYQSWGTTLS